MKKLTPDNIILIGGLICLISYSCIGLFKSYWVDVLFGGICFSCLVNYIAFTFKK